MKAKYAAVGGMLVGAALVVALGQGQEPPTKTTTDILVAATAQMRAEDASWKGAPVGRFALTVSENNLYLVDTQRGWVFQSLQNGGPDVKWVAMTFHSMIDGNTSFDASEAQREIMLLRAGSAIAGQNSKPPASSPK